MQRFRVVLFAVVACFAITTQALAQASTPKPNSELTKLHVFNGHWTGVEDYKAGPWGAASNTTAAEDNRMFLGGSFQESQLTEKGAKRATHVLEVDGYDATNKNFTYVGFVEGGITYSGVYTFSNDGNSWNWNGKAIVAGKEWPQRGTGTFAADRRSFTMKSEASADGKTWLPYFEEKWTKGKPTPKK